MNKYKKSKKSNTNTYLIRKEKLIVIPQKRDVEIENMSDIYIAKNDEVREKYYNLSYRIDDVYERSFIELFTKYLQYKLKKK